MRTLLGVMLIFGRIVGFDGMSSKIIFICNLMWAWHINWAFSKCFVSIRLVTLTILIKVGNSDGSQTSVVASWKLLTEWNWLIELFPPPHSCIACAFSPKGNIWWNERRAAGWLGRRDESVRAWMKNRQTWVFKLKQMWILQTRKSEHIRQTNSLQQWEEAFIRNTPYYNVS